MFARASVVTTFLSFLALGTGCANEEEDTGAEEFRSTLDDDLSEVDAARSGWEGTAEGVGLIAFINDKGTTFDLLDKKSSFNARSQSISMKGKGVMQTILIGQAVKQ